MTDHGKKSEKRPRSHSAKSRPPPQMMSSQVAKETKERIMSAKAIKNKHTSSAGLFVPPPPASIGRRFTSMYAQDFDGTFVPPADLRPTSPTRRNNPHPTKVSVLSS